jgi:hypothetical protein
MRGYGYKADVRGQVSGVRESGTEIEGSDVDRITTTIKREFLREIVAKRKHSEYREIKPYWTNRFSVVTTPFQLRLINGMSPNAPEVTVMVLKITKNGRQNRYELHLGEILGIKNWDAKRERPR